MFQTFAGQIARWLSLTNCRRFVVEILLRRGKVMVIILR